MGVRVAVAGASGYAGGELLRIITRHPGLEAGPLAAAASAGAPVTLAHPHLALLAGHAFEALDPGLLATADLVFLALPHEESAAVGMGLPAAARRGAGRPGRHRDRGRLRCLRGRALPVGGPARH